MRRSESVGALLVAGALVAIVVSLAVSIFTLKEIVALKAEVSSFKKEIADVKSGLSRRIGRIEDLIGPNSPIDKYINDVSYVKGILSDLDNIKRILSEMPEDPTSGYFRVLVIGSEKVWFEVGKGNKKYFAQELFPGLSPERFYYFKPPNVDLDYIIPVPSDSYVVVGKPGRVFLIFFGVGVPGKRPVKIVQLSEKRYPSLQKSFNLYIPGK